MANNIQLFQKYISLLDEVYKTSSKSSILDGDESLVQAGKNANEIVIPKLSMDGLANYSRNSGYVKGDVTLTYETVKFNYDRGRKFVVDAIDEEETAGIAFGKLSSEFIRTRVVPEMDAFRFATYSQLEGIGKTSGTLASGADVIAALRAAANAMDEAEVPAEQRILFITPSLNGMIADLDTSKSKEVLGKFSSVVEVPQSRFNTKIKLFDGTTGGEEVGGYEAIGSEINFMIVHAPATKVNTTNLKIVEGKHVQYGEPYKYGTGLKYGTGIKYGGKYPNVITYDEPVNIGDVIISETEYLGDVTGRVIKQTFGLNGGIIIKDTVLK